MFKKIYTWLILILIIVFSIFYLFNKVNKPNNNHKKIITANNPIKNLIKEIVKDDYNVVSILKNNQNSHDIELTSKDILVLKKAKLIIYSDADEKSFTSQISNIKNNKLKLNNSYLIENNNDHEKEHEEDRGYEDKKYNEHYLYSIDKIIDITKQINDYFKGKYQKNYEKIEKELKRIKKTKINKNKIYISEHSEFDYLARDYNLEIISINQNHDPDSEISSKNLASLIKKVKKAPQNYVFLETNSKIKQTTKEFLDKTKIKTIKIDSIDSNKDQNFIKYYEELINKLK